jgi:Fe-S cluster biogenesis protein NfuA/nitrite reductase/ring-hydroxylating ferredoxin subunit
MGIRCNLAELGNRLEQLLEEVRSMAKPPVVDRVDQIVRSVVQFYGAGLGRIVEIVASSEVADELLAKLASDELVGGLLILHGLHPEDFATRVQKALTRVRPYLGSHGGDVEILKMDSASGLVRLRLKGSCDGCPSSLVTVTLAVESAIKEMAPEATRIEVEGLGAKRELAMTAARLWIPLQSFHELEPGRLSSTEVEGFRIVLCRWDGRLYAYRDLCPACKSSVADGDLESFILRCPACRERYDVKSAGRSLDKRELYLKPVPLLEEHDGIKVAVPTA